ncbi:hypothetical protein FRC08_003165 [Ceratobasidium sp. 394]|nr:hypothetical protein FRC08_003165 [Ceratobasidium sp. 394]
MPPNSQLEFILGGVQNRMAERQAAINTGNIQAEWQVDQAITQGLYYAGNACPANHPGARQGFHNAANRYSNSRSRGERDNLVYKIAKSVIIKKAILAILLGAGTLTIAELAAPATMFSVDGTEFYGHAIDNEMVPINSYTTLMGTAGTTLKSQFLTQPGRQLARRTTWVWWIP